MFICQRNCAEILTSVCVDQWCFWKRRRKFCLANSFSSVSATTSDCIARRILTGKGLINITFLEIWQQLASSLLVEADFRESRQPGVRKNLSEIVKLQKRIAEMEPHLLFRAFWDVRFVE